ncbi:hypothetical protein CONPUDRAFT_61511, partial [Coniophora puteana RWD-64-598 SS2]
MLTDRRTCLRFDDYTSAEIAIRNGIVQGDPFSMLLYVIYCSRMLRIADTDRRNELVIGYVDDTTLLARGKTYHD